MGSREYCRSLDFGLRLKTVKYYHFLEDLLENGMFYSPSENSRENRGLLLRDVD